MLDTKEMYDFPTRQCQWCGKYGSLKVTKEEFLARADGAPVHEAFPNMPPALREQAISGTHPDCWSDMFA